MHFFDYHLPEHLIAQHPAAERDAARLLVVRRDTQRIQHHIFRDLPELLSPGDLVVLNDTRVLPARVVGRREATGGKWEGLFLRATETGLWEMLAQTRGYPEVGTVFVTDTGLRLVLRGRTADRHWLMQPEAEGTPPEILSTYGHIPLPPYIRKGREDAGDRERYQTVYAGAAAGSVAAPTAGLHFTPAVFDRLTARGIGTARVTLHVGLGTFAPVKEDDPTKHAIHHEWCAVPQGTVDTIRDTKARGGRVVAIGTTTTRTLESAARPDGLRSFCGETGLFIHEPFEFRAVDALVTNFHLPRTTLLLLVGALAGDELLARAYAEAVTCEYRFFSYGDAMLVL
ncbi:S-adenosylmethionine:tRNA ribosyltransferase-isomerase [Gemmata obscuriglobus]|uniref:S-adenosylmethionine:tRNA ribosyltransferase-isomerase n=1 Tax=Gemmata obscuriglobus TaxID=114 RepID=A0A2Z3HC12_9BACT|nr:tRNA preQ1(34) S-adenosylmethionine ribosyltransferase-isomerase QueA [Gemmata obscuriglobus]AWM41276.1 S-adenosylmethionine:tRNA ribosyltransferase-isomerase [Gemmata obscuriglobus]QEG25376.1 S-adenosylmethionine:tRNA ribosyltransferase-isomerase [Gemmata obscuriglobus]VTR98390.1 s-adenosylmethionine trna ribosyltransferase : S-adenosylmethionine:tRNA ribosyltransferase-isomerase OS=Singulisphaera acidiphila (strain ATCC BAA-1392 / DSM 18658 / VKM B-2454 / MOB10) GN=queA PE=3 SV=1: Queuosine